MSDITGNEHINKALEKLNNDGFKKHRRSIELYAGSVIILNLIGANFKESNPLGIPLATAERPGMVYWIVLIIGIYLLFRYTIALNTYLKKHIRNYLQEENTNYFMKHTLPKVDKSDSEIDDGVWTKRKSHPNGQLDYGRFDYVPRVRSSSYNESSEMFTVEKKSRVLPTLKHLCLMHFKGGAIGWDLWMPYYLIVIGIISALYNYFN